MVLESTVGDVSLPRVLIAAKTSMGIYEDYSDSESTKRSKEYIKANLKLDGFDLTNALDDLFDKNRNPLRLTIESNPSKGYVIGSMKNPPPTGLHKLILSRPGIDNKSGLILIYLESKELGVVEAYSKRDNKVKRIGFVRVWVS